MVLKSEGHGGKPMGMSDGRHLREVGGVKYENSNHIGVGEAPIGDEEREALIKQLEEKGLEGAWQDDDVVEGASTSEQAAK